MDIPSIFPVFGKPKNLMVFRSAGLEPRENLALNCLQGLVNVVEPRIYEVTAPCDEHWLRYYKERFDVASHPIENPMELLNTFSSVPKGLVIYDPEVPDTRNIAITISGLDGLIPADDTLTKNLGKVGLQVKEDLRGRFHDRLSTYTWAKEELLPRCYGRILGSLCVGRRGHWLQSRMSLIDYLVANKSFVFHLSAARRDREENRLFDEILVKAQSPGVIMGWHCARDQEKEYVSRAARKGFFVLCSSSAPNLTVHGGIPRVRDRYVQRKAKPLDKIENKVYLSLYLTDGDAIWAMNNLQSDNWLSERRGSIPFNWGLLPLMYDICPGMLEYYYETATEKDYFACPSSGAAYTYSYLHGDWYLRYSKHYMDLTGQRVVNTVNWDTNFWWREVENPAAIYREKRMLDALGMVCGLGGSVFAKSYPTGTPKVHAAVIMHVEEDCAKKIQEIVVGIKERPLFIFAFVQIKAGVYDHLVENLGSLPEEVELLHMDAFMMGLRKAVEEGLIGDELYPSKERLAEPTLAAPGRQDKAAAIRLLKKLADVAALPKDEMARELNLGNWINLAARPPSAIEAEFERWREINKGYLPYDTPNLADALGYNLFYTAWAYVRGCLNSAGRYANHMDRCLDEYLQLFPDPENGVLEEIWEMWRNWNSKPPNLNDVKDLTARASRLASRH